MRRASAAFGRGDLTAALRDAEQAHRAQPRNAAILQFIGVVQCASGQTESGLANFRKALSLAPGDQALRFNAAKAAYELGNARLARDLCIPIVATPDGAKLMAAIAGLDRGADAALTRLERLAAERPEDHEVLNNFANALGEASRSDEAQKVLERAVRLAPNSPQLRLNLGRIHASLGHHGEARDQFVAGAGLPEASKDVRFELGQSLLRHGQHELAMTQLAEAARLGLGSAQLFVMIGVCFFALEQRDQAEQAFATALGLDPANARAALNLAMLFERENRVDELRDLFAKAREAVPRGPDLDFIEALVLRRDNQFEAALDMARRSASESIDPTVRAQFVGQVADRLGRHEEAFAAYDAMNREALHNPDAALLDPAEYPRQIRANTALVTPQWYASWSAVTAPDVRPAPAFLCGFLRSGTTLLDTILMGHPGAEVREEEPMLARLEDAAGWVGALPAMRTEDIARMRGAYFAELAQRGPVDPARLLVDKYPLANLRATYIHRAFPDARFIFALRHPCDVVLSCWMQNFRPTTAMASFLTLESAARMYAATMEHWLRCREVLPLKVHTMRYEDMIEDLEGELRPLLDFLGLDWDERLLNYQRTAQERGYIRTPSYSQVTEGLYRRSSGRWEHYREQMAPVLDVLAPWAIRFGYPDPRG